MGSIESQPAKRLACLGFGCKSRLPRVVHLTFLDPEVTPWWSAHPAGPSWVHLPVPGSVRWGPGNMRSCLATTQDEQQERWASSSPHPGEAPHWSPVGARKAAAPPPVPRPHLVCRWRCPVELHNLLRVGLPWSPPPKRICGGIPVTLARDSPMGFQRSLSWKTGKYSRGGCW